MVTRTIKKEHNDNINQSDVYNHIHYLLALNNADVTDRINMLRTLTLSQMDCLIEIARRIYDQKFTILTRDILFFRRNKPVLQSIFSGRISFRRKVVILIHHHTLIPRLLRIYYIMSTIRDQVYTPES